jgi:replication factor A1
MIEEKQKMFNKLISDEVAACLVAKDFGLQLLKEVKRRLEIKNIVPGMKKVNIVGRIFKISQIVEFKRNGVNGKVVNLFIGDSSGFVRLPLWNEQVKEIEEDKIKVGDVVQVIGGYARENIFGNTEISLGKYGRLASSEETDIPSVDELIKKFYETKEERKCIKDLKLGKVEILATIIHVFKGKFIFNVCPICEVAIKNSRCEEHGDVSPEAALIISCILDDGTGDIRATFFRETAENLIEMKVSEVAEMDVERRYEMIKDKLVGKEVLVIGNVKMNKIFNRVEIIVNEIKDLNILEESKRLLEEIKIEVGYEKV